MDKKNFKAIGSNILKDILDSSETELRINNPKQLNNSSNVDLHKIGSPYHETGKEDIRLHVYISREIENKLLDEVYRRKRDKNFPKSQASKRVVVEDALLMFLSANR